MSVIYDDPAVIYDSPFYIYDGDLDPTPARLAAQSIFAHLDDQAHVVRIESPRPFCRVPL